MNWIDGGDLTPLEVIKIIMAVVLGYALVTIWLL